MAKQSKRQWPEPTATPPANGSTWMHPAGFVTEDKALDWSRHITKWDVVGTWQDRQELWHLRLRARGGTA